MSTEIDRSFGVFKQLRPELQAAAAGDTNESDVRFKIIDRLLVEVLGWSRDNIRTEAPSESGFLDYLISNNNGKAQIVLEAKKSGRLTPATASEQRSTPLLRSPTLKPLADGIQQALSYAAAKGLPFAALSDGTCWLFFKGSRGDGVPPLDGHAVLFPSMEAIEKNFGEFYELASSYGVRSRLNQVWLNRAEGLSPVIEEEQFVALPAGLAKLHPREDLARDANLMFKQFFSRLTNDQDKEMLRECFAETGESQNADYDLRKIVEKLINSATTRTHRALIRGEYDRYSESENPYVINLFWTDPTAPSSPLLSYYLLEVLKHKLNGPDGDIDARHWPVANLIAYFEACGVAREATLRMLNRLYKWRLIDDFDPTSALIDEASRVALRECGAAHLDLALKSAIYLGEMALATGLNSQNLADQYRRLGTAPATAQFYELVRLFMVYVTDLDAKRFSAPEAVEYFVLRDARRALVGLRNDSVPVRKREKAAPIGKRNLRRPLRN